MKHLQWYILGLLVLIGLGVWLYLDHQKTTAKADPAKADPAAGGGAPGGSTADPAAGGTASMPSTGIPGTGIPGSGGSATGTGGAALGISTYGPGTGIAGGGSGTATGSGTGGGSGSVAGLFTATTGGGGTVHTIDPGIIGMMGGTTKATGLAGRKITLVDVNNVTAVKNNGAIGSIPTGAGTGKKPTMLFTGASAKFP